MPLPTGQWTLCSINVSRHTCMYASFPHRPTPENKLWWFIRPKRLRSRHVIGTNIVLAFSLASVGYNATGTFISWKLYIMFYLFMQTNCAHILELVIYQFILQSLVLANRLADQCATPVLSVSRYGNAWAWSISKFLFVLFSQVQTQKDGKILLKYTSYFITPTKQTHTKSIRE